jgi:phosphomannomutase
MPIKFGTDGWRAVISDEFTFANVRHVAKAIADYLLETRAEAGPKDGGMGYRSHPVGEGTSSARGSVAIGFDTRFLSDRYAMEVARVMADAGLTVYLTKSDCPTPALAYAIRHLEALGGIMITASHNPPRYNGIKFKGPHTGPALPEETQKIERILERNLAMGDGQSLAAGDGQSLAAGDGQSLAAGDGRATSPATQNWALSNLPREYPGIVRFDPMPPYLAHVRTLIDFEALSASGLRVVVDPMYGAGRGYIAAFLREAGCQVTQLHGEMNPGFGGIHPEPIERNLHDLMSTMRSGQYDIGLATDGDADRIGAVDAQGNFVDPHRIFSLILRHLVEERGEHGSIVKTVSTTQLLNRLSQHYGLPLHETPVGFNQICAWFLKEDVLMGGEESGGMTIKGHVLDGDGILMGLLLAELLAYQRKPKSGGRRLRPRAPRQERGAEYRRNQGRPLHEVIAALMEEFGEFHYGRTDVHTRAFDKKELTRKLTTEAPQRLLSHQVVRVNNSDGVKYLLDDDSWLLIRPSGTEPLLRIYAEARSRADVPKLLAAGAGLAGLTCQGEPPATCEVKAASTSARIAGPVSNPAVFEAGGDSTDLNHQD